MIYSIQEIERVRNDQWSKGTGGVFDRLMAFGRSCFLPVSPYLTRTLRLRKIGQGIRNMYLAPHAGLFLCLHESDWQMGEL